MEVEHHDTDKVKRCSYTQCITRCGGLSGDERRVCFYQCFREFWDCTLGPLMVTSGDVTDEILAGFRATFDDQWQKVMQTHQSHGTGDHHVV